jgi:Tol biopolymer transport system component
VLTSLAGTEEMVSFSPSGNEIAFSWKPEGQDNFDVYVKQIGPGRTIQLTKDPADDMAPRWSPDGKLIAFLRRRPDSVLDVFVLPAWGGLLERKVGEANGAGGLTPVSASLYCLDWSPDGRWLVVTKRDPGNNRGIALVPVEPGQPRWLTSPRMPEVDGNGTIAPDGHALAFYRSQGPGLLIQPLSASLEPRGPAKAIPLHTEQPVLTLSWTADSRDIIFSAGMSDNATLWRVPAFGGTPKRLSFAGDAAIAPAISRRGKRLAFERYLGEFNIWSLDLDEKGQAIGEAVKAFNSSKSEICPRFSPDGTKVAFESGRSGNDEIWVCLADDSKCQQLTFFNGPHAGSPAWSPNGEWIVFDSFRMGTTQMYLVNSGGGEPKPLADDVMAPAFSHDGEWIVFRCSRADEQLAGLCRIPVVGGRWERLTEDLGFLSMPSKDGQWIYYSGNPIVSGGPASRRYLRKIPASGGAWTEVLSPVAGRNFAVVKDGVWYLTPSTKEGSLLQFYDFATKKARTVYRTNRPVYAGFTVSPNERRILFTQVDRNPDLDLVLVDNFR